MAYTKEQRVINQINGYTKGEANKVAQNGLFQGFELPNKSGDHIHSIKTDTPTFDEDLVNKKYVDDSIANGGFVPYTGASSDVDLNTHTLTLQRINGNYGVDDALFVGGFVMFENDIQVHKIWGFSPIEFQSMIQPDVTNTLDIGSTSNRWKALYAQTGSFSSQCTSPSFVGGGSSITGVIHSSGDESSISGTKSGSYVLSTTGKGTFGDLNVHLATNCDFDIDTWSYGGVVTAPEINMHVGTVPFGSIKDLLYIRKSGTTYPKLLFSDSAGTAYSQIIYYNNTDILSFSSASGGYEFDNKITSTNKGTFGNSFSAVIGDDTNKASGSFQCSGTAGDFGVTLAYSSSTTGWAGYFNDDSSGNSVFLCDGSYSINSAGAYSIVEASSSTETIQGCDGYSAVYATDTSGSIVSICNHSEAINVSGGQVYIDYNGTYALNIAVGNAYINGTCEAVSGFIANGSTGYTGDLNDSTSTKIADVVGGIITAVYY